MRPSTFFRSAALLCAGALALGAPATASAQGTGSIDTGTLGPLASVDQVPGSAANLAGGALALAGSSDLGTQIAGGRCASVDPAAGSIGNALNVTMESKEGAPGVAATEFVAGPLSATSGTLHWTNETTGATGAVDFGPLIADAAFDSQEIETGAGHVAWTVDAVSEAVPFSIALPLSAVGIFGEGPVITTPVSTCTGAADIA